MGTRNRAASTVDASTQSTEDIATATTEGGQEVVVPDPQYSIETLQGINSFEDALNAAGVMFGGLVDASEVLGDGFKLLNGDGKSNAVGKPMVLLEWSFYNSAEYGGEFASMRAVVQESNGSISKYIINDGSTGVCQMLRLYTQNTGRRGGVLVRNGLRESSYPFCNDCGHAVRDNEVTDHTNADHKVGRATTYYIDTSA